MSIMNLMNGLNSIMDDMEPVDGFGGSNIFASSNELADLRVKFDRFAERSEQNMIGQQARMAGIENKAFE